jgi:hypothetical protein
VVNTTTPPPPPLLLLLLLAYREAFLPPFEVYTVDAFGNRRGVLGTGEEEEEEPSPLRRRRRRDDDGGDDPLLVCGAGGGRRWGRGGAALRARHAPDVSLGGGRRDLFACGLEESLRLGRSRCTVSSPSASVFRCR